MRRQPAYAFATLACAFALSNALRTLPAITAPGIEAELHLSEQQIGYFAGSYHVAFALMQLPIGVALDRLGPRLVAASMLVVAGAGSALCAAGSSYATLIVGQLFIGIGCAPALMATFVFINRAYPPRRFSFLSGLVFAIGGLGLIVTGTPLAWIVEQWSWRAGFAALWAVAALSAVSCWLLVDASAAGGDRAHETLGEAIRGVGEVLRLPQTAGILAFGLIAYSVMLTFRSLWIAPLFARRHGFDLVEVGHVILAMSLAMIAAPPIYGYFDPGTRARPKLMIGAALATALCPAVLALGASTAIDILFTVLFGIVGSFQVLLFSAVRDSYAPDVIGRALAMVNMAVFLGVAIVQGGSGLVADWAGAHALDRVAAVSIFLSAVLIVGALAYALLPRNAPPQQAVIPPDAA
ncbi:MAG: MFS transporter [Beijerinckiaceae bacterium]